MWVVGCLCSYLCGGWVGFDLACGCWLLWSRGGWVWCVFVWMIGFLVFVLCCWSWCLFCAVLLAICGCCGGLGFDLIGWWVLMTW